MAKSIDDVIVHRIHRHLLEFGYSSLRLEEVTEQVLALQQGETPRNIIAMFTQRMLEENGYL